MKSYFILTISTLFSLSVTAQGLAEAPKMCPVPGSAISQKEDTMFMEDLKNQTDIAIPPIDRAIPDIFETAAFGLG